MDGQSRKASAQRALSQPDVRVAMASAMMSTPAFAMRHSVRGSRAVPAQAVRPARAAACRAVKPSAKMSFEDASKAR